MRRPLLRITLGLATIAFAGCLYVLGTIDAYQANLRYILWKHHAWPLQRFMLPYLSVDGDFVMSLRGKTKEEVRRYFPVLIPADHAITDYQKSYSGEMIAHHRDFLWIGDSGCAVEFKDGKVTYVGPIKG
jgi:hypothetical protein